MIGDQLKRELPPSRYSDPEEPLAGKCMTCKTVVSCLRRDTARSGKPELGVWGDLVSAECPSCGARVFVMPAAEFWKIVEGGIVK